MNEDEVRDEIKRRWLELWPRDKGRGKNAGIVCPLCKNGSGKDGDGVKMDTRNGGEFLHCFKCGFSGDAITLLEKEIDGGYSEAIEEGARRLSLPVGLGAAEYKPPAQVNGNRARSDEKRSVGMSYKAGPENTPKIDFSEVIEKAREGLNDARAVEYLAARGISIETAAGLCVGFDPAWINPRGGKNASPRMIIPFAGGVGYLARAIGDEMPAQYAKQNAGAVGLFGNVDALDRGGVVFVVEGWADACAVIEAGYAAISLNGAANGRLLIEAAKEKNFSGVILLALDNDDAGKKATERLQADLDEAGVPSSVVDICGGFKDENDFLVSDRDGFSFACFEAYEAGRTAAEKAARPDVLEEYFTGGGWLDAVEASKAVRMPTGFPALDDWLGGGLYEGLSVLSGLPSLGKTSLLWQIAENIAAVGFDVIFFSIEMSKAELVAKSLSRHAWENGRDITADDMQSGREKPTKEEAAAFLKAAARLSVIEGGFNYGVDAIGSYIEAYMKRNGGRVCVFVDYLQAAADAGKTSEIMAISETAKALRQLARKNHCPIVCASSMARTNYGESVGLSSFYGSGAIEYSADMAAGLQLQAIGGQEWRSAANEKSAALRDERRREMIEEAKAENPRRVAFVGAKNRRGLPSCRINFLFDARHALFSEEPFHGTGRGAEELSPSDVEDLLQF